MKLYAFYYEHSGISYLYGYTTDKKVAKEFMRTRNQSRFRLEITKFSMDDIKEGYYETELLEEIMNRERSSRSSISRLEINFQPLTDGVDEFSIPMTYDEISSVSGKVTAIEEKAMENIRTIEKMYLPEKTRKLLVDCNKVTGKNKSGDLYSVIDSFSVFVSIYGSILDLNEK